MIRALARPMLASWFVYRGVRDALDPQQRAAQAEPVVRPLLDQAGAADLSTADAIRMHGVATAAAAATLALSRTPRTAGVALTGLAAVSAAVYAPFWRLPEGPEREAVRDEFVKNLSLVGGAMLAATAGHSAGHVKRKKARKAKAKARKAASGKESARKESSSRHGASQRKGSSAGRGSSAGKSGAHGAAAPLPGLDISLLREWIARGKQ